MLALFTSIECCIASRAKSSGLVGDLAVKLLGQLPIVDHDQPAFHGRAELRFVGLLKLLVGDRELIGGQLSQGQRRPEDVALVLLLVDAPFALEHVEPLFAADLEPGGHAVDFRVDFLVADHQAAIPAVMHDEPLVHQPFQHLLAEAIDAGRSQRVAADILAVDDGHHIVLRPLATRQHGAGLLCAGLLRTGNCGGLLSGRLLLRLVAAKRIG